MNLERAVLRSKLADDRQELQRVEIRADALLREIRQALDPYAESITDVDTGRALSLLEDLHNLRDGAVSLSAKIKEYEEALNG